MLFCVGSLCCSWVFLARIQLHIKAGFYQHQALGQVSKSPKELRSISACLRLLTA